MPQKRATRSILDFDWGRQDTVPEVIGRGGGSKKKKGRDGLDWRVGIGLGSDGKREDHSGGEESVAIIIPTEKRVINGTPHIKHKLWY
jgi:hypothetical protein